MKLYVNERFKSFQGEIPFPGKKAWFIRMQGCNVNCAFCVGVKGGRRIPKVITSRCPSKRIMDIIVGDKLIAVDDKGNLVETEVIEVFSREVDEYFEVKVEGRPSLFVTPEHPFLVEESWVEAKDIKVGDEVFYMTFNQKISFNKKLLNPMKRLEVRTKILGRSKGRKRSFESREKMREARKKYLTEHPEAGKRHSEMLKGKVPWNKGLTRETDERVAEIAKKAGLANKGKKRSEIAKERYRKVKREKPTRLFGQKNPNWSGGIVGKKYNHNWREWFILRKKILRRDNYTCQRCGSIEDLVVHHINFDVTCNVVDNLCVLCRKCNSSLNRGKHKIFIPLVVKNGLKVEKVKYYNHNNCYSSQRPFPIKVFNFRCEPYANFFVEYLAVHNCDTKKAWDMKEGERIEVEELVAEVPKDVDMVVITGGEPLLQVKGCFELMKRLAKLDFIEILDLETSGQFSVKDRRRLLDLLSEGSCSYKKIVITISPKSMKKSKIDSYYEFWMKFQTKKGFYWKFVVNNIYDMLVVKKLIERFRLENVYLMFQDGSKLEVEDVFTFMFDEIEGVSPRLQKIWRIR